MKSELDKYDLIIRTARKIIITEGYSKLSISKLTKKCKISKGSFYTYFKTKDSILEKIIDDFQTITIKDLEEFTITSNSFIEFIKKVLTSKLNYDENDFEIILAMVNLHRNLEIISDSNHSKMMKTQKLFLKYIKINLENHLASTKIKKDEIDKYSDLILSIINYLNLSLIVDKGKKKIITLKSIKNIKNDLNKDENLENIDFIIKTISKIIN